MPRVFIRHQTGSKAGQTDMLDFVASHEVLIGRGQGCALAYDEKRDETVSRQHARIVQNSGGSNPFTIENLSGNGTFVDGTRIAAPTPLSHGSTVKLGQTGPTFIFETDPPPASARPKATVFDFGDGGRVAPKVYITHKTGSKAPRKEPLDFTRSREVLIGRDPACGLVYDEQRDETVSRQQAKIVQNSGDPRLFTIENLSRTNGTFVDDQKIATTPAPLSHGNVVKFGPSGPSFIFELDPPPASKLTVADFGAGTEAKGPTKDAPWWEQIRRATISDASSTSGREPDGRWNTTKIVLLFAMVVLVTAVGVGLYLYASGPKDSASILKDDGAAVVSIDANWRLFDPESGRQAYHWYVPSPVAGGDGRTGATSDQTRLPVFVQMGDGGIEPVLILDDERDTNRAIAGRTFGSGCVVHDNGFILTSSLVAGPFNSPYAWPNATGPALLIDPGTHSMALMNQLPTGWIPASSRFVITRRTTIEDVRMGRVEPTGRQLEGRLDTISVGFSGSENRISAKLVGMSANKRMALLKGDALQPLHAVALDGSSSPLAVADRTYLIGYSVGSGTPKRATIRLASVVKVAGGSAEPGTGICPGCYQISESGADSGFNGGPVFDDHGRLMGVFLHQGGEQKSPFAVVPVQQAADLLGLSQK